MLSRPITRWIALSAIGSLVLLGPGAFVSASAATVCESKTDSRGNVIFVCYDSGGSGGGGHAGNQGAGAPSGEVPIAAERVCAVGDSVIPCETKDGVWNGRCYQHVVSPPPPLSDPVWLGHSTGVIVSCTTPQIPGMFTSPIVTSTYWAPSAPATAPAQIDPAVLARRAIAALRLSTPPLEMSPPPNLIEPNVVIRRPAHFWFSTSGPATTAPTTASASDSGLTVTATARLERVTFDTGDGSTITCTPTQVAAPPDDLTVASACGHTWERPSTAAPGGTYTVTATSHWAITWAGADQSGQLQIETGASLDVAVVAYPTHLTSSLG